MIKQTNNDHRPDINSQNKQENDEYKNQQTANLSQVSQQTIMQNLTHYFVSVSSKQMPYLYFFTKHDKSIINSLAYLYTFIRAGQHSKKVNKIFFNFLYEQIQFQSQNSEWSSVVINKHKLKNNIDKICKASISQYSIAFKRITLLSRYISLPSIMAQYLSSFKLKTQQIQKAIANQLCLILEQLQEQQKIYLINKIIMLGYSQQLLLTQQIFKQIQRYYKYITCKDKVINSILNKIVCDQTTQLQQNKWLILGLYSILQSDLSNSIVAIISILHRQQPYLLPSNSTKIYKILSKNRQVIIAVFDDLLQWWCDGNDQYLIYNMIKFRTNMLALCLRSACQKDSQSITIEDVISRTPVIGLGIQKRLMLAKQNSKQIFQLIWGTLIKVMGLQDSSNKMEFKTQLLTNDIDTVKSDSIQNEKIENKSPINHNKTNQQNEQKKEEKYHQQSQNQVKQQIQIQDQPTEFHVKTPKNLYDCILGMRNQVRKKLTLHVLPKMIRRNPDDLIFTWQQLIQQLFYSLNQQSKQAVVSMFVTRPEQFIENVTAHFFKKDQSLNDKIVLIECLTQGVEELAERPREIQKQNGDQQFYFKKVRSKYYNQMDDKKNKQKQFIDTQQNNRTRRWGHTRIAYQSRKSKNLSTNSSVSLKIIESDPYINRLYEVANQLFFRIISRLSLLPIFPSQPMFTNPMLKLLAILSYNLKNHIQKYKILVQVIQICKLVIDYIQKIDKSIKQGKNEQKAKHRLKWKDTHLGILNVLNKVSLVIDKYIPNPVLQGIQKCITKLKLSPQYGINPIINMIEANIYTNVSGQNIQY